MDRKAGARLRTAASKHTNLASQQRRLRHLRCIIGRNIEHSMVPMTKQTAKSSLLNLFCSIHSDKDSSHVLYKTEVIENTLNPNWREFDYSMLTANSNELKSSSMIVCIWGSRKSDDFKVILKYHVDLSGLQYIREQLHSNEEVYEANCLLFRLFDGYYGAPRKQPIEKLRSDADSGKDILLKVYQGLVLDSYKMASLIRVHYTMKAVYQTKHQVADVKNSLHQFLKVAERKRLMAAEKESLICRTGLLEEELGVLQDRLLTDQVALNSEADACKKREEELAIRREWLEQYISDMKISHSAHIERREALLNVNAQLNFRRRQLAAELSFVYPIMEHPLLDGGKREHAICGVRLPNTEEFLGEDEQMLAVALGYVCHLVYMTAKLIELPLRYPLKPMGSRSCIMDLDMDKLNDKEREFPLYSKGKEKFQFRYGVFLLNKNIAQLRCYLGLATQDLRTTLINLKSLYESKFGVRVVVRSSIPVTVRASQSQPQGASSAPDNMSVLPPPSTASSSMHAKVHPADDDLSAIPNVVIKSQQQQYNFISRNVRKKRGIRKSRSLPDPEFGQSPDLMEVPIEELLQRGLNSPGADRSPDAQALRCDSDDVGFDAVVDVLVQGSRGDENHDDVDSNVDPKCPHQQGAVRQQTSYHRQLSDALIIPGPFDELEPPLSHFLPRSSNCV